MKFAKNHASNIALGATAGLGLLLAACTSTEVVRNGSSGAPVNAQSPARASGGYVPMSERVSQPKYGATVIVEKGNTVYHLATTNGITPLDLALWNNIPPPYTIYPGQRLKLYPSTGKAAPAPAVATKPVVSPPVVTSPTRPGGTTTRPTTTAAPTNTVATVATAGNVSWRWPTDGNLLTTYKAGEPTRQGIDIAGTSGQPVRAASDGTVVYSGAGLVGYGELIIIKHNGEWLSAYGHNRKRLVSEGQKVSAGQQIAELGRTAASRDMLHFEIRYDGKPVDPQQYLPKR